MHESGIMCAEFKGAIVLPGLVERYVEAFGDKLDFRLTGEDTGGRVAMFYSETQPGGGPPPHWHDREDEWFLVLEGRAEFFLEGVWREVPMGTALFAPRGQVHTFRNAGDVPLKQLIQTSPSGFERFFAECAREFHREGGPDMARIMEISALHGIHFAEG